MEHPHAADRPPAGTPDDRTGGPGPRHAAAAGRDGRDPHDARVPRADVRTFGGDAVSAPALLATLAWQSVPARPSGA